MSFPNPSDQTQMPCRNICRIIPHSVSHGRGCQMVRNFKMRLFVPLPSSCISGYISRTFNKTALPTSLYPNRMDFVIKHINWRSCTAFTKGRVIFKYTLFTNLNKLIFLVHVCHLQLSFLSSCVQCSINQLICI